MPKRIGYLYDSFLSIPNCIEAEKKLGKNKPDNKMAQHISKNAEHYGKELHALLVSGEWRPAPSRKKEIKDTYKGKTRKLEIPILLDQGVQQAWLNIAIPYIERRNYYYNCGSIPGAGQTRCTKALKKWLGKKKPPRYAFTTDIRHFYESCPHSLVMRGLRRIFKDERFLRVAELILSGMGKNGVGLSIGHLSSHWFANVALMPLDHELCEKFPEEDFTRYMDDLCAVGNNKRHLRNMLHYVIERVRQMAMQVKANWQLYPIKKRPIQFLSYRFSHGYTRLVKPLMYRIARKMKRAAKGLNAHLAASSLSYMGILKHCDSYHFKVAHVFPYIRIDKCKEVVSNESKNRIRPAAGAGEHPPWPNPLGYGACPA